MKQPAIWLYGALAVFILFLGNVALASSGGTAFVGRTGEMLLILLCCILFVTGTLRSEANRKARVIRDNREETT